MKPKNCLENLQVCKASCCKVIFFNINRASNNPRTITLPKLTTDLRMYYEIHGLKVKQLLNRTWQLTIPEHIKIIRGQKADGHDLVTAYATCQHLTPDFKCGVHDTDKQPYICKGLNAETASNGTYTLTEGCMFKNN